MTGGYDWYEPGANYILKLDEIVEFGQRFVPEELMMNSSIGLTTGI